MKLKALSLNLFILVSFFSLSSFASNIECDKLDFKGGVFAFFDMEDDNIEEVKGSHIFHMETDGLEFNDSDPLIRAHFLESQTYVLSDIEYKISHHPESGRCQMTLNYKMRSNGSESVEEKQESYELIALSFDGIYWFGQRDRAYSEAYFYLEKVN